MKSGDWITIPAWEQNGVQHMCAMKDMVEICEFGIRKLPILSYFRQREEHKYFVVRKCALTTKLRMTTCNAFVQERRPLCVSTHFPWQSWDSGYIWETDASESKQRTSENIQTSEFKAIWLLGFPEQY